MTNFEELYIQQIQLVHSFSQALSSFIKLVSKKISLAVINSRIERVKEQFAEIRTLDAKMNVYADEKTRRSHSYFTGDCFNVCEIIFHETMDFMAETAANWQPVQPSSSTPIASHASTEPINTPLILPPLPPISSMFPIHESFSKCHEIYRQRFKSMVINDPNLSDVQRMHYLCLLISSETKNTINQRRLAVTDNNSLFSNANLDTAWYIITSHRNIKRRLLNMHLQTLSTLPQLTSASAKDLQTLRDKANTTINALKGLNRPVDTWDDVLIFFVTQKLDKASEEIWEGILNDTSEFPSYEKLDKFLETRIHDLASANLPEVPNVEPNVEINVEMNIEINEEVLEVSTSTLGKPEKAESIWIDVTSASVKSSCVVCNKGKHALHKCIQFLEYEPARRHSVAKENKRCLNCLAADHSSKDCKSDHRCHKCQQRHHTLVHLTKKDRVSIPISSSDSKAVTEPTADNNKSSSELLSPRLASTEELYEDSPLPLKTTLLLATARINIYSTHGQVALIRALLDQNSAVTLISEQLSESLCLPRVSKTIGNDETRFTTMISIGCSSDDKPMFTTTAVILNSFMKYAPAERSIEQYSHLANLKLADFNPTSSDSIDVILGADLYDKVLRDGTHTGAPNEPVAQNTAFGWIIFDQIA